MKKVLYVTHSYPSLSHPAKGIFILDELKILNLHINLKVCVVNTFIKNIFYRKTKYDSLFETTSLSYFSLPLEIVKLKKGFFISKSLRQFSEFKYFDIIHTHFLVPSGLITPYINKPNIITVHGSDWNKYKDNLTWFPILKKSLKNASAIIVVSDSLKLSISNYIPEVKNNIYCIPHSFDSFWLGLPISENLKNEKIKIVTVASLIPTKGVIFLIKALQKLSPNIKIELTIFSIQQNKSYSKKVYAEINKLRSNIVVNIKGESSRIEIRKAYHESCFSILPSIKEGFGLSIIEANACGLPVISTNSGGPESIINYNNGILVEPGNSVELKEAILKMIQNLPNLDRLKLRNYTIERFSSETKKESILKVYNAIS